MNIFESAATLSKDLHTAGEDEWGTALDDALHMSGMAGEILGQVRLALRKLRQTDIPHRLDLESRIQEILDELDRRLGPWLDALTKG
jgi:hypothetical protein